MDDISCFVIGTSLPNRRKSMLECVENINNKDMDFKEKYLIIDDFGEGFDAKCKELVDWRIVVKPRAGMVDSHRIALNLIKNKWVLYCEDDVKIERLPKLSDIESIRLKDNREIGMCSLMANWDDHRYHDGIKTHLRDKTNYVEVDDGESVFWLKDEQFKNEYWVVFPVMLMRTDLMRQCLQDADRGMQIEQGYSKSWFRLGFDKQYGQVSYMRNFDCSDITPDEAKFVGKFTKELIYVKTLDIDWCQTHIPDGRWFI